MEENVRKQGPEPGRVGTKRAWWLRPDVVAVVAAWVCTWPFHDYVALVFGYPLRVMATELSVGFLRLVGVAVENEATTINVGTASLAITDACSGIEELLAMLLVGWLLARCRQRNVWWALFAMAFSIPAVVVANAVRLVALVLLYGRLGECVLTGAWHVGLGYAQVALALALMWGAGEVVRKLS